MDEDYIHIFINIHHYTPGFHRTEKKKENTHQTNRQNLFTHHKKRNFLNNTYSLLKETIGKSVRGSPYTNHRHSLLQDRNV